MSQMSEGTCETKSFFDQRSRQNADRRHLVGMPPAVHSEADRPIHTPGAAHKAKWIEAIRPEREQNVRRSGMVGEHRMAGKAAAAMPWAAPPPVNTGPHQGRSIIDPTVRRITASDGSAR